MDKTLSKDITAYFKERNRQVIADQDLSLYGFTMFTKIGNQDIAFLNTGGTLKVTLVRVLNPIHKRHIDKLEKIRKKFNNQRFSLSGSEANMKRNKKRSDWFRKIHTEVYKRGAVN